MKIVLLTIAVFLACVINGLLLVDAMVIGKPGETTSIVQMQTQPATELVQIGSTETVDGIIVFPSYTNHWNYKPRQPVRNLVRYVHNRISEKYLGREYYYCTKSR